MEEKQVTVDGETRVLAPPFFVIATQNPVETTGTFPLPEAQLDRFLMKLSMGTPTEEEELQILDRYLKDMPIETLVPVATAEELLAAREEMKDVYVHPLVLAYITQIAQASRTHTRVLSGVSPRGTIALLHAAQAYAYISGRDYVVPEDVKALAVPVLAHRILPDRAFQSGNAAAEVINSILEAVPAPTENWKRA